MATGTRAPGPGTLDPDVIDHRHRSRHHDHGRGRGHLRPNRRPGGGGRVQLGLDGRVLRPPATVSLAAMATATSRIRLGSAIVYAFGRSPLLTVTESRDLDELSGGRLVLGLGTGTRHQVSGWLGLDPDHLAPRMEELVPLLRRLWRDRNRAVHHQGRFYRLRLDPVVDVRPPRR